MKIISKKIIIVLLFISISTKSYCQNMIIINSNNYNNVTALDSISAAVTPIMTNYLSKVKFSKTNSGYDNKIVLGINEDLENNEFVIKSTNTTIQIEASSVKYLRYGVYTLLEIWGFRKFTSNTNYVPEVSQLEFPENFYKKYQPSFSFRSILYPDAYDEEYRDWHKLDWNKDDFRLWGHSFNTILSAKQYFESNPNYFAFYDKKYNSESLCMTNEESFEIIVKNISQIIVQNPAKYYSISQTKCFSCSWLT